MGTDGTETSGVTITAQWLKAVAPSEGGQATLLIGIATAAAGPAGVRRAPVDVAFVLDRSGSMSGEKLELAKQATSTALGLLRDEDRAALVVFDDQIALTHPLAPATDRAKAAMRLALHGVDPGGSTNLSGGWLTGCEQLASALERDRDPRRLRRALLLTDGQANVGIVEPGELVHHASELRRRGIATSCIGIGDDYSEVLLAAMSEAGGGEVSHVNHAGELPRIFARELGELLEVVAAGLTVSLTLPHGVRGTLVNAFANEREGKRIDVALGDVETGREIFLVFDLAIAPTRSSGHRVVVNARWTDPAADARREVEVVPPLLAVMGGLLPHVAPENREVAERVAIERAHALRREAMRLDREGQRAESRARLQQHQAVLYAAPVTERTAAMLHEAAPLAALDADAPIAEGVRKQVTADAMRRSRGKRQDPQA